MFLDDLEYGIRKKNTRVILQTIPFTSGMYKYIIVSVFNFFDREEVLAVDVDVYN